jgi:hypothetical protein
VFALDYRFDRAGRIGRPAHGPYARLRVLSGARPLSAVSPRLLPRVEGAVGDVAVVVLGLSVAWLWVLILAALWPFAVATAAGGALVIAEATRTGTAPGGILVALVCALVLALAWKRPRYGLSFGFVALAGLAVIQAAYSFPSLHAVLYRGGGSDWLTYESFARDIFTTHSLQGGEDVFYYQPGYRYLLVVARLVFGEGDMIPSALAQALTNFGILVLAWRLAAGTSLRGVRGALVALGAVLMLAVLNSATILSLIRVGVSEWPT